MKKIGSFLLVLLSINLSIAQDNDQTDSQKRLDTFSAAKKHELSIDVLSGIAIPAINPRYEYVLGRYSGIGVDLFVALDNDDFDFEDYEKFSLTPYYRQYFFSKEDFGAKGFYGEGFVKFYTFEYIPLNNNGIFSTNENGFETAIGAGIGWKWVSDSGFLIDLGLGIGRNLGFADEEAQRDGVMLRGGLNFGWRF